MEYAGFITEESTVFLYWCICRIADPLIHFIYAPIRSLPTEVLVARRPSGLVESFAPNLELWQKSLTPSSILLLAKTLVR